MVNPGHLAKLKEGVEVWNRWRDDNLGILPALWAADLKEADLRKSDLKRADLEGTYLKGAIFLRAEQLCKSKTLHHAELDPHLEREVRHKCPLLFEKPREKADR